MISEAIMMAMLSNPMDKKDVDSGLANLAMSIATIVDKKAKGDVSPDEIMDLIVGGKTVLTTLVTSIDEIVALLDDPTKDDIKKYAGNNPDKVTRELERVINHGNNVIMMIEAMYSIAKTTKAFHPFESIADGYFKEVILKMAALRNHTQALYRQFNQHINPLPAMEVEDGFGEEDIALFNSSIAEFNQDLLAGNLQCR
ncbi:hypothetical protein ACXD0S_000312 [Proteus mirabilis]|uniref:hypothetical protein n=1 Tax=Proteus mirabilis TaxID=584 RepID=UPI0003017301|nr:hypothetical protein [Proteus mirabilis]ELA9903500.1 hypothetical protein [Proteus mirabilis]MBG2798089.1 hypothetical protein [Proteus mirabilis]MBI6410726.1 hypothetical protein [Proteus mirabilis]MBI6489149.1 hypothetical protein [Proteus mirabilis]MDS0823237.1 hypothetical protein [Proteus mirabilis]